MRKLSAPLSFLFRLARTSKRQDSSHLQVVLGEDNLSRTPVNFLGNWMPAELVGLIFDHCDSNTLRTSSLVCKYWRASTIHHLFSWAAVSPATTPAFFDFLETKSEEHVGWFVRSLSLTTGSDCGDEISTAAVRRLSSHLQLSSLKLSIYENDMDPAQRKDLCVFHSTFETITTLELALYSNMFIEAAEVISSFPVLETLIISGTLLLQDKEEKSVTKQFSEGGTGMYRVEQELPINHTVPSTVHTVHFPTLYNSSIFLHWLQSHKHKPLISTLVLGGGAFPPSVASMTSNYLRELGDTLQCLTMTEWWLGPIRHFHPEFLPDLSYNTSLHTLAIHSGSRSSEAVFRVLSRVASLSVEEVEFDVWDPADNPIGRDRNRYWPRLDSLLAGSQFPKLQWVIINVKRNILYEVEARLPILKSRNLLHFRSQLNA